MKKAFSLLELIFAIVVIGIIASFAIPKYMNTKDDALATTIKRDLMTSITSIQSYYLINQKIENIEDAVSINGNNWQISENLMVFNEKEKECLKLNISDDKIIITIDSEVGNVCKILHDKMGVKSEVFELI